LGVRQLREFNSALLGKWCWRMLVDRDGLWYRVLVARYGEEAGRLEVGGRSTSSWWKEVVKIRDGMGEGEGSWFEERVSKRVGNGVSTYFWYDRWLGDVPLRTRFSRLFDLANNKLSTVADLFALGWETEGGAWNWRRPLWVWEEELVEECRQLLNGVVLQSDISDRWLWDSNNDDVYTVRGAYQILTTMADPPSVGVGELVWHKQVPLKVSIMAWRLLLDRLPTKVNLVRRGCLDVEAAGCMAGCGIAETANHLFLHCTTFGEVWHHIRAWIGVSGVDPHDLSDHFIQFINCTGHSKARRSFLQLIWLLCVWMVWNERNNRLFNNIHTSIEGLSEKVKLHSLWWLKASKATFVYGDQKWWSDPMLCLGIDAPGFV
jgi:hypothetical protein